LKNRFIAAWLAAAVATAAGCNGLGNTISGSLGGSGNARLIIASPKTTQTGIALQADHGTINSGLSASAAIGTYAKVNAGNVSFDINTGAGTSDLVPAINVNIAASTNYSIVLEGEPGLSDYMAVSFADTNALNNSQTVRFKVNNAAPNLATPVDVYVWLSSQAMPTTPTVPALPLNQDSGSEVNAPGNAYIPTLGSGTILPSGTYNIAIVPQGTIPNGTSDLFDGSTGLNVNISYSFTIEDMNSTQNNIGVLLSVDEPFQTQNQLRITKHSVK